MTEYKTNLIEIYSFWNWFSQNCKSLGTEFDNEDMLNELDHRISQLGGFSWEIGPGREKSNALVISPNGNLDLLEETRKVISIAAECDDWEYYYAKQPKEWNLVFDYHLSDGCSITIDALSWTYVLLRYEDGLFAIIIKVVGLNELDDNDRMGAAEIVLDGVLGEERRINTICEVDIVEEFESSYNGKNSNIMDLPAHLKKLTD